jgi:alpha-D-xyloside xylohydrolase
MALILDAAAYLRIDAPQTFGTSESGASFATSTGDIFEVSCFGPGLFRLRLGPSALPDYGILAGRVKPCTLGRTEAGAWTFANGDAALEISGTPLRFRLLWKGAPVLGSTEDESLSGGWRLPAFGRLRNGSQWTAAFALASGDRIYGLGESFGPLDKRGQLLHSHVDDAQGVNGGLMYRGTPFAWSTGSDRGAWGMFVHTPGMVSHGAGYPEWSHRSYAIVVEDEALDIFLFAGDTPGHILAHYMTLTGRPAGIPDWSLGVWVESDRYGTPERAAQVAGQLRERKIPCDVMMLDAATLWGNPRSFDFSFDRTHFPDPKAAHRRADLTVCEHRFTAVPGTREPRATADRRPGSALRCARVPGRGGWHGRLRRHGRFHPSLRVQRLARHP